MAGRADSTTPMNTLTTPLAEQIRALSLNLRALDAAFRKVPFPAVRHLLDQGMPDEALFASFTAGYAQACHAAIGLVSAVQLKPSVRNAAGQIDTEKLGKLIADVARETPVVTLEFEAATKLAIRDLCVLFGAGSYTHGREKMLKFLASAEGSR